MYVHIETPVLFNELGCTQPLCNKQLITVYSYLQ